MVVLRPDVEVAVSRNAARLRETGWGVPEWQVRANHEALGVWAGRADALVVDNSRKSPMQVLATIDEWESRWDEEGERVTRVCWP